MKSKILPNQKWTDILKVKNTRRDTLKKIAWTTPVIASVPLPLHAMMTPQMDCVLDYAAGSDSIFIVPEGVTSLAVEVAGAVGGPGGIERFIGPSPGGQGAIITGTFPVTPGDTVRIVAGVSGGPGSDHFDFSASAPLIGGIGGFGYGTGGDGGSANPGVLTAMTGGGGGGGGSAILVNSTPVVIAGGGGGGGGAQGNTRRDGSGSISPPRTGPGGAGGDFESMGGEGWTCIGGSGGSGGVGGSGGTTNGSDDGANGGIFNGGLGGTNLGGGNGASGGGGGGGYGGGGGGGGMRGAPTGLGVIGGTGAGGGGGGNFLSPGTALTSANPGDGYVTIQWLEESCSA